jgi:signal transduction histidine kinase
MKSVSTRFLIPFGLLAVLGSVFFFYQTYESNRKHAYELINQQADMAMEFNLAIRGYAGGKIRPVMESLVDKDVFIPETMSTSFISRRIFEEVNKKFPGYVVRFSSDNPRNPINRATPDERQMIEYFRQNPQVKRRTEEIQIKGQRYLAHFTRRVMKPECMRCHGDPKDAPAELVKRYGPTASFHRKVGDVAGLDTIAVPVEAINATLASMMRSQSLVLAAGLVFLFGSIFLVFKFGVTRRLVAMANHFDEIAAHTESPWMTPVEVKGNDEISVVGVAFNKLVEQLRATHASLEKRVNERTEALRQLNEKLQWELSERKRAEEERQKMEAQLRQAQKMEAIGTLAGGIAHDFNNILGAIMGFTELTRNSLPKGSQECSNLTQVLKAGERARDLVKQILVFSRGTPQERRPLHINSVIKETLKLLRASLPATINIQENLTAPAAIVLGDQTQIQQVLMNLAANAAQAIGENGGILEVNLKEIYLGQNDLGQYPDLTPGPYVMLSVRDTGQGMGQEVIPRIFEPFFTTKGVGKGTGMGLAIVHGIVKANGGEITVSSQPGQGAAFTILLPKILDEVEPGQEVSGPLGSPIPTGNNSILFIDDEEMLAHMAKKMLIKLGYEVVAATSSLEAIKIFQSQPEKFDLVITDQTMPEMTGIQLSQKIRQLRPDIPIIICTGYSEKVSEEKIKAAGINDLLMKPFGMHNLAVTIRKVLD